VTARGSAASSTQRREDRAAVKQQRPATLRLSSAGSGSSVYDAADAADVPIFDSP
jgi:hypothetical protein